MVTRLCTCIGIHAEAENGTFTKYKDEFLHPMSRENCMARAVFDTHHLLTVLAKYAKLDACLSAAYIYIVSMI